MAFMPTFGKKNALGFAVWRGEWKHLVVCVEYDDGTESMVLVEAPQGRGDRSVSVVVP